LERQIGLFLNSVAVRATYVIQFWTMQYGQKSFGGLLHNGKNASLIKGVEAREQFGCIYCSFFHS
jgi:hypothetical protein